MSALIQAQRGRKPMAMTPGMTTNRIQIQAPVAPPVTKTTHQYLYLYLYRHRRDHLHSRLRRGNSAPYLPHRQFLHSHLLHKTHSTHRRRRPGFIIRQLRCLRLHHHHHRRHRYRHMRHMIRMRHSLLHWHILQHPLCLFWILPKQRPTQDLMPMHRI